MTIGVKLGCIIDEIGSQDFFHAFFSTVSHRLEPHGWGQRFPNVLNRLYQGELEAQYAQETLTELDSISTELMLFTPNQVVWDIEDLSARPPWGDHISGDITDLSHYFVTSTGRDLILVLKECIEDLRDHGGVLKIVKV